MKRLTAAAAALLFAGSNAGAQSLFYGFDDSRFAPTNAAAAEAAFLASLASFGTESFVGRTYANPFTLTFGVFGAGVVSDPVFDATFNRIDDFRGLLGQPGLATGFGGFGAAPVTITFTPGAVRGLGFYVSGMNDIGAGPGASTLQVDFFDGATNVLSWLVAEPSALADNTMFVGMSGLAFTSVELRGQNFDGAWFNNVTAGTDVGVFATPEPTSLALLGAGVAGLCAAAARRRRAQLS